MKYYSKLLNILENINLFKIIFNKEILIEIIKYLVKY